MSPNGFKKNVNHRDGFNVGLGLYQSNFYSAHRHLQYASDSYSLSFMYNLSIVRYLSLLGSGLNIKITNNNIFFISKKISDYNRPTNIYKMAFPYLG